MKTRVTYERSKMALLIMSSRSSVDRAPARDMLNISHARDMLNIFHLSHGLSFINFVTNLQGLLSGPL